MAITSEYVIRRSAARVRRRYPIQEVSVVIWFIIVLLIVGFLAGALARLLVPGPDPMSLGQTWLLGVVGSFVGGFLGYVIFGADIDDGPVQVAGVVGSVLGSIIVLLVYRAVKGNRMIHH